jgi:E3 ubiquitin-protein ligase SIAH1
MQSQFSSVEQSLYSQLECPVCMEYMRPPIVLCANGHNICDTCKQKVPHCPTCRQQFLNTRNVALEKVAAELKYPCMYRDYGCREMYKLDLIGGHKEKCQFIPQPCPVSKLNIGTCSWLGIRSKINSHLKQAHNNVCVDYHGHSSCGNRNPIQITGVTPATKHCKFIFAYNGVFYSRSEIKNGIFYSALQYIDPAADAAKYKYKLEFFNTERTESLAVTLLARSLDEDLSEVHNSGNCVKLYPEQFNRFVKGRNELAFSMDIIKAEHNYSHDYYGYSY